MTCHVVWQWEVKIVLWFSEKNSNIKINKTLYLKTVYFSVRYYFWHEFLSNLKSYINQKWRCKISWEPLQKWHYKISWEPLQKWHYYPIVWLLAYLMTVIPENTNVIYMGFLLLISFKLYRLQLAMYGNRTHWVYDKSTTIL